MRFILIFSLFYSSVAFSLGRTISYEEFRSDLFHSIQELKVCGSWREGIHLGEFRLIRVYAYGQDLLFVDSVKLSENQTKLIVNRGYSFQEINNDHAESGLSDLTCEQNGENQILITGINTSGHSGLKAKFEISIKVDSSKYVYVEKAL